MNEIEKYNTSFGNLIEPESISYSFNTPGWYLVLGLLFVVAIIFAVLKIRKYKKNAYRRQAIIEIESLKEMDNHSQNIFQINQLLKIIAIKIYGRTKVASLYGKQWFEFLVSTISKREYISTNNFNIYAKALYNNEFQLNENQYKELVAFAILWIKKHSTTNV